MGGKYGVKETKEVVTLAEVVTVAILQEVKKDGFQVADLGAFLKSADFEKAVAPALQGIENVPAELTELDLFDGLELGKHTYGMVQNVLGVMKAGAKK